MNILANAYQMSANICLQLRILIKQVYIPGSHPGVWEHMSIINEAPCPYVKILSQVHPIFKSLCNMKRGFCLP